MLDKKIITICLALILSACASNPSHEKMRSSAAYFRLPHLPAQDKAAVYIVRPGGTGTDIKFNVFLDNRDKKSEMGYTKGSQYIYFNVSPGKHTIYSKAENWAIIDINAHAGDVVFLKQNPKFGWIMARNSMENIDSVEGKYYVSKFERGHIYKIDNN